MKKRRRKARYDGILTLFTFDTLTHFEKKIKKSQMIRLLIN